MCVFFMKDSTVHVHACLHACSVNQSNLYMCIQLKLSEEYLETLGSDACDLGSVSEETEGSVEEKETFTLSSYDKVGGCVYVCVVCV